MLAYIMRTGDIRSLALLLDASPAGWAALHGVPTPGVQPLSALAYAQQVHQRDLQRHLMDTVSDCRVRVFPSLHTIQRLF